MSGDFPVLLGNTAANPAGYLQAYVQGMSGYKQFGKDIPNFGVQQKYAQEQGGPLIENYEVSGSPSFDMKMPYIPGGQNFEGIPNASPEMLKKLQQRREVNPGGQMLPRIRKV